MLDPLTQNVIKTWITREPSREIPWTAWRKPLAECTVAMISSAGAALKTNVPFDQEAERQNPWWGDPSYRIVPRTTTENDVGVYHLHIDTRFAMQDLDCIFPFQRLLELEAQHVIGRSAACLTDLLLVRRTSPTGNRKRRHPNGCVIEHS